MTSPCGVYIIMNMNIYITKANEKMLREHTEQSMSGLINYLLAEYFDSKKDNPASTKEEVIGLYVNAGAVAEGKKWCKHGYDPKFCKFAKPGKACK